MATDKPATTRDTSSREVGMQVQVVACSPCR